MRQYRNTTGWLLKRRLVFMTLGQYQWPEKMVGCRKLTGKCAFCLPVLTLLTNILGAQGKIRVGVPDQSISVAKLALQETDLFNYFELLPVRAEKNGTILANINKTFSNVSSLDLEAIVGPSSILLQLVAEYLDFPYICTSYDISVVKKESTFEMLPETDLAGQALLDVMKAYGWNEMALFYDNARDAALVEQLVTSHSVLVHAWRLSSKAQQRQVNSELIQLRKNKISNILIVCNKENTRLILNQALNLAMLATTPYHWMFYDPGLESLDVLTMYTQIQVNFTVVSLLGFNDTLKSSSPSKIEFALTSDAFKVLSASKAIQGFHSSGFGYGLSRAVKETYEFGHTGVLAFDPQGRRKNVTLILTTVVGDRSVPRGMWYSNPPARLPNLNLNTAVIPLNQTSPLILSGMKVKVVVEEAVPFVMLKKDYKTRKGNDRFQGYAIDLIDHIATELNFKYEFYLPPDRKFGTKMENGLWSGVVGELISGNASMAVGPLTITADRETAVDFTKPFMTTQISVLIRIPTYEWSYLQILSPFSVEVWILIIMAFVVVSWSLFVLEKIGHALNPVKNEPEPTLGETIWFTFGSLVQGTTVSSTSSLPGRILTGAWWVFALILISSYTANLAAFLTAKNIETPIKSTSDLAQQSKVKYGTIKDTSVSSFFKTSKIGLFANMWAHMSQVDPNSMLSSEKEAINKVKKEDYAFFWDSTIINYLTKVECNLMEIGPPVNPKGYGIAVPAGASYLDQLSMEILRMSDAGILENLRSKWWDISNCPNLNGASGEATSLELENFLGIVLIVVCGIVSASIVCFVMYCFPSLFILPEVVTLESILEATFQDTYSPSPPSENLSTSKIPRISPTSDTSATGMNMPADDHTGTSEGLNMQRLSTAVDVSDKRVHFNSSKRRKSTASPVLTHPNSQIPSPTATFPLN